MSADLPKPDYAHNMRIVGHCDQCGRPGVQIMVQRGYAYIGHMFSKGFSVVDVRDAMNPRAVNYFPAPLNTWNIHLQTHDDLLLVVNAKDMFAEFADEKAYYKGQPGKVLGTATAERKSTQRDWTVGLAVYDISKPDAPRRIGFMAVDGGGIHRLWYGRALCLRVGPCRRLHRLHLHDGGHERSSQSARSRALVIPGMNQAAGEMPSWPATSRYGLHHAIVHGDTAYAAWRDAAPKPARMVDHRPAAPT